MTTLPADIVEHYYSLHNAHPAANTAAVINTAEEAGRELWLLFSGAITSEHLPYSELPQERKYMLHFYEYMKALLEATYALKVAG